MRNLSFAILFMLASVACRSRQDDAQPPPAAPEAPADAGMPAQPPPAPDAKAPTVAPPEAPEPEEPTEAESTPRKLGKGERAVIRIGAPVVVMNLTSVDDGLWRFPYGSACFTELGGRTEVLAIETIKEEGESWEDLLILYQRPPKPERMTPVPEPDTPEAEDNEYDPSADDAVNAMPDHPCPSGTLYFMEASEHVSSTEPDDDEQRARVERLLKPEHGKRRRKR